MKDVLERLATARGVRAAALYDHAGACLAWHEDAALAHLGGSFVTLLSESTARFAGGANQVVARFDGGTLVLRRARHVLLAVIGEARLDATVAGAGFAMNVALQALQMRIGSRRPVAESQTVRAAAEIETPREALRAAPIPKI